jgi:hypothetical protein
MTTYIASIDRSELRLQTAKADLTDVLFVAGGHCQRLVEPHLALVAVAVLGT